MNALSTLNVALCVRLIVTFGHFLWQGAAIGLVATLILMALQRASASVRYRFLVAALISMAACPIITYTLLGSGWEPPPAIMPAEVQAPVDVVQSAAFDGISNQGTVAGMVFEPAAIQSNQEVAVTATTGVTDAPRRWDWPHFALLAVSVYFAGVLVLLARIGIGLEGTRRMYLRSEPVRDIVVLETLKRQSLALGLKFVPAAVYCRDVVIPTVIGVFRPTILLPFAFLHGLPIDQLEVILAHELAHIRRYDHFVNLLQRVIEAFLFFHPAVWWISHCIRIERENCCDDLAIASAGKTPLTYAGSLLEVAELCHALSSRNPAIEAVSVQVMTSPSRLRQRISRLLGGHDEPHLRLARGWRLSSVITLALSAVIVTLWNVRTASTAANAVAADDEPLPPITAQELAKRMSESMERYARGLVEVEFDEERDMNAAYNRTDIEPVLIKFPGRFRYVSDGRRWRANYDSRMPTMGTSQTSPYEWVSGFDGQVHFKFEKSGGLFVWGDHEGVGPLLNARDTFWSPVFRSSKVELSVLEKPDVQITSGRLENGPKCYVVKWQSEDGQWGNELWVCPDRSHLVLKAESYYNKQLHTAHELHDLVEIGADIWFPSKISAMSLYARPNNSALDWRRELRITRFEPEHVLGDDEFKVQMPLGIDVQDRRTGLTYHNDPWWPELSRVMREQFDWPPADVAPLRELASNTEKWPDGRAAPPIQATTWLNSTPLDWNNLRGKVTLVEFWGTWCPPCREKIPALRRLYELYKPAGLEIVSIHTPTDTVEEVREFANEMRMLYPIAVDVKGETSGATAAAYGVTGYPSAFLVDHEGKVHFVEQGRFVETMVDLLTKAGAKDLASITTGHPEAPKGMDRVVQDVWKVLMVGAPSTGIVVGRITDAQGAPVAGATIRSLLKFTRMISTTPHGYTNFPHYEGERSAATDKDGKFAIIDLCKGTYDLTITAPGKAAVSRRVLITADLEAVNLDLSLEQSDGITGRVFDMRGKPIPAVTVQTQYRHFDLKNLDRRTWESRRPAAITDDHGTFQLQQLMEGAYTIDFGADGYETTTVQFVKAGTRDIEVRLAPKDAIAWGTPNARGMQLGAVLDPPRTSYNQGETLDVRLFIRNTSREEAITGVPRRDIREAFDLELLPHGADGEPVPWRWGPAYRTRDQVPITGGLELRMQSGASHELPAATISLETAAPPRDAIAFLAAPAGKTSRLRFRLDHYGYAKGQPIESGVIEFTYNGAIQESPPENAQFDVGDTKSQEPQELAVQDPVQVARLKQSTKPAQVLVLKRDNDALTHAIVVATATGREPESVYKKVQDSMRLRAAAGERIPSGGSLTDQETIVSAERPESEGNTLKASLILMSLPEGSGLRAEFTGESIEIRQERTKTKVAVRNGQVRLVDAGGVTRAAAAPTAGEPATLDVETWLNSDGEVVIQLKHADPNAAAPVRVELDATTGVPVDEKQPPHGAVRYKLLLREATDKRPTQFKMQWIYDIKQLEREVRGIAN